MGEKTVKISSLMEVISAAHLTAYVEGPWAQRGGLFLVAPAGTCKTTILKVLEVFPNCRVLSDINVQTLLAMHSDIAANHYRTLAFTEVEKIYMRHTATAANVEGTIKAMAEEGFRHPAFNDQRMVVREARCLIVGAMTPSCYTKKFSEWKDEGFLRRFLWCHFILADPWAIVNAIHKWEPLQIYGDDPLVFGLPADLKIKYEVSEKESNSILAMLKHQDPQTPFILMKKIYAVLMWRYPRAVHGNKAWEILSDFAECLSDRGADLILTTNGPQIVGPRTRAKIANKEMADRARRTRNALKNAV